jgi:hypothetical protein
MKSTLLLVSLLGCIAPFCASGSDSNNLQAAVIKSLFDYDGRTNRKQNLVDFLPEKTKWMPQYLHELGTAYPDPLDTVGPGQ